VVLGLCPRVGTLQGVAAQIEFEKQRLKAVHLTLLSSAEWSIGGRPQFSEEGDNGP
jgi:hypothetical protein